jgi:hypothetical protein
VWLLSLVSLWRIGALLAQIVARSTKTRRPAVVNMATRSPRSLEGTHMSTNSDPVLDVKVYTITEGRAIIEQSSGTVVLEAEQIQAVIKQLHACYDYCAVWKQTAQE